MPRGDKSSYTYKQKRQAEHVEAGYEHRGVPEGEAERRAWATVNKETGGGKISGSGRGTQKTMRRRARAASSAARRRRHVRPLPARRQRKKQRRPRYPQSGSSRCCSTAPQERETG